MNGASRQPSGLAYRPEIDGLRAIAVLTVVLFHFGFGLTGGFVGVDVFFVISGYLITSLIRRDLDQGTFSFPGFWERRARRIVPAMVVVLAVSLGVASWLLLPLDFLEFARSLACQTLSGGNFFFWRHTGYFHPNAEDAPLLHTWSLAVEEQFYLVVPVLLWGLCSVPALARPRSLMWAHFVAVMGGLAVSAWMLQHSPPAAFYLVPSRAWELLLGGGVALLPARALGATGREVIAWGGLLAILVPSFAYDRHTPFPGLAAIPPCLGSAAILYSVSTHAGAAPRFGVLWWLSRRPLVWVGLISYSLYLWHWPVMVFGRYYMVRAPDLALRLGLLAGSIVLAIASWRFVETPFRARWVWPTRGRMLAGSTAALLLLLVLAVAVWRFDGVPQRFSEPVVAAARAADDGRTARSVPVESLQGNALPPLGVREGGQPVSVLLWGDSHAMAMLPAWDRYLARHSVAACYFTQQGVCPLLGGDGGAATREVSSRAAPQVLEFIARRRIAHVIIAAYWPRYASAPHASIGRIRECMEATIRAVRRSGARVYFLQDVPTHAYRIPYLVAMSRRYGFDFGSFLGTPTDPTGTSLRRQFATTARESGAVVLDPWPLFVDAERGRFLVEQDGAVLYRDAHHLSTTGALRILDPWLEANPDLPWR